MIRKATGRFRSRSPRQWQLQGFGADTATAITGIAGPVGERRKKPVGTVCFTVLLDDDRTATRTVRRRTD